MTTRVLLIDELEEDQEMYRIGLAALGLHVELATEADATEKAGTLSPDVIVLHPAHGRSWSVCDALHEVAPSAPVIVLTAAVRPDAGNRRMARAKRNCAAFVGKPCTHVDLAELIRRVLDGERGIELTTGAAADE